MPSYNLTMKDLYTPLSNNCFRQQSKTSYHCKLPHVPRSASYSI